MSRSNNIKTALRELAANMRAGSAKTLPAKGTYWNPHAEAPKACALGAAYVDSRNLADMPKRIDWDVIAQVYPVINKQDGFGLSIGAEIIRRNDRAGESREAIADWLEELSTMDELPFDWSRE